MSVSVTWLNHASFRIEGSSTLMIDPWKIPEGTQAVKYILISHSHQDHYSSDDIVKGLEKGGEIIGAADVIAKEAEGRTLLPGDEISIPGGSIRATAAYNIGKEYHPRKKNWLGFLIKLDGFTIYYAGDTDRIPEMKDISGVDLALLPAGGTYTMDSEEAAQAVKDVDAVLSIPYHWGDIVGSKRDADKFKTILGNKSRVLYPGDTITLE